MTTDTRALSDEMTAFFNERMQALLPQSARYRYFQRGRGPMFVWTVEPFHLYDDGDVAHGKYESLVMIPFGPGSKSGKATRWKLDEESSQLHVLRKDAKARALRLFKEWEATQ